MITLHAGFRGNDTQHNDTQHYNICYNDTHTITIFSITTLSITTLSITTFSIMTLSTTIFSIMTLNITINKTLSIIQNIVMLSVRYTKSHLCWVSHTSPLCWVSHTSPLCWVSHTSLYAECHLQALYAECQYAECHYAECRCAVYCGAIIFTHSPRNFYHYYCCFSEPNHPLEGFVNGFLSLAQWLQIGMRGKTIQINCFSSFFIVLILWLLSFLNLLL
jgi:hypothetical protein